MQSSDSAVPYTQPVWSDEAFEDCLRSCKKRPKVVLPTLVDYYSAEDRKETLPVKQLDSQPISIPIPSFFEVLELLFAIVLFAAFFLGAMAAGSIAIPLAWWLHAMVSVNDKAS